MQEKQDWRILMFSKESMSSKLISNDPKFFFKIHGGDLGRITTHTFIGRLEILLDLSFEAILLCFWSLFWFVFVLRIYFVLIFYLGLRSLFIFLCGFWMLIYLHMLLSWVHLILLCFIQVFKDLAKITLLMEGSACLIKKKVYG